MVDGVSKIIQVKMEENNSMRYLYFLQQFFDRLPAPAFIKDNKGRYIWVNKELENAVGLTEERIIGKFEAVILNDRIYRGLDKKGYENT